jgi:hypothetical protein
MQTGDKHGEKRTEAQALIARRKFLRHTPPAVVDFLLTPHSGVQ